MFRLSASLLRLPMLEAIYLPKFLEFASLSLVSFSSSCKKGKKTRCSQKSRGHSSCRPGSPTRAGISCYDAMFECQGGLQVLKAKRVRINPTKKWTIVDEKALIEFLMANGDFEKPTDQNYYRRFSLEMKLEVEWKLARAKVRNMRDSYNKAEGWEGSTGAGSMDGDTFRSRK
ncbi:PREDICTED: uncharacterized protein LOC108356248 isoform X2 [Rhagoletis zephyria]|uniref:uncharacterized protein LOC108356248 isoform X2 n=2 Tax=Rhagoletis TaxID=28609 RepID=UPI00081179C7|nr:PREDICTED: uncharacterized protein LOC108356248 isoform X2 [Rhagoletis zephyria]XP_017462874.1 PREDICTED: uncharacterized protein LOC108356248 isoform X2 [Rhagoletis zephyria]